MLAVVQNETLDARTRQLCLDEILKNKLDETQRKTLSDVLSGIKPGTLKVPK